MLTFDAPEEVPPEFLGKARRYGWPQGAELVPVLLGVEQDRPGELGRVEVRALTVALAAVVEHDGKGPVLVGAGPPVSSGTTTLADGLAGAYTIRELASPDDSNAIEELRVHVAGTDLVPPGTPVVIGSTSSSALLSLRREARLHRLCPASSPADEVEELPLIVLITDEAEGDSVAARVAAMDPFGVSVAKAGDLSVVVLAGSGGAQMLMELSSGDPALRKFRSRLRASKGMHAVLVADEAASRGEGEVYGLFEFHLPEEPERRSPPRPPGGQPSVHRRRKRS